MITVTEALDRLLSLVVPTGTEEVPLTEALGRQMIGDAVSTRTQPPFSASAMDGYAVAGHPEPGDRFIVIGEAAAGSAYAGALGEGQAVRIFTGAPLPEGATRVVIQEDVTRTSDVIEVTGTPDTTTHVRPAGGDFSAGDVLSPRTLGPSDIAMLGAMGLAQVNVARRPVIAILPTGNELVQPGETPGADQIVASNSYGLHALLTKAGAVPKLLPIARDDPDELAMAFDLAAGADLLVTIGGASVGDHDLVGPVAAQLGMERAFYKVAMRPGKPLMAGRLGDMAMVGLPGNPVSAMVCGHIFLRPMIDAYLGRKAGPLPRQTGPLAEPLPQNGPREHYMRAILRPDGLVAHARQDSSLLSVLAASSALIVRSPHDPPRAAGELVEYLQP